jgi:hypothetical protein
MAASRYCSAGSGRRQGCQPPFTRWPAPACVQPERAEPIWNLRGVNCNSWHRVTVAVEP